MNRCELISRAIVGMGVTSLGTRVISVTAFSRRAESDYGHLLTVDRSPFARPLS
jgi:hypothetical protein